jgi:hypothetical protein
MERCHRGGGQGAGGRSGMYLSLSDARTTCLYVGRAKNLPCALVHNQAKLFE